jgi:hypothetical protein
MNAGDRRSVIVASREGLREGDSVQIRNGRVVAV